MRYTSTRSGSVSCTFEEAICSGYAPDGGLFVPDCTSAAFPLATAAERTAWFRLSYLELTAVILRFFISRTEVSDQDLHDILKLSFDGFEDPIHVVPIIAMQQTEEEDDEEEDATPPASHPPTKRFFIAELFKGPTFCFKDLAMRVVVNLLEHFMRKRRQPICLLAATTGDTGPALARAVADIYKSTTSTSKEERSHATVPPTRFLTAVVHYPDGQISDFQRKQLTTVNCDEAVRIVTFQGGGDDMDAPIKSILSSEGQHQEQEEGKSKCLVGGVNSFNIGRPLMQAVHFVWTYLRVVEQIQSKEQSEDSSDNDDNGSGGSNDDILALDIIVPTGAWGNLVGGYFAKALGVPIATLVAACNVNDITFRVLTKGDFSKAGGEMLSTLSEAINIQVPYNFERILYYMTSCNHKLVHKYMTQMEKTNKLQFQQDGDDNEKTIMTNLQEHFDTARVSDEEMCQAIRFTSEQYRYLVDPHTAVALAAADKLGYIPLGENTKRRRHLTGPRRAVAVLATASPCKFEKAVTTAIGSDKWKKYADSRDYPVAAREILTKAEVPPVTYEAVPGKTLEENQIRWEQETRRIIDELQQTSNGIKSLD